jgi:uncharacterized protein YifE (UPF0438 family)
MQIVRYIILLCSCPKYEQHIRKMKSPIWISLVLFHSINGFLQSVEYTTAIFRTKPFSISADFYLTETQLLQKNNKTLLVATEKSGHEVNAEKSERMFVTCDGNKEECHNIKYVIYFLWGHNTQKSKLHLQINRKQLKVRENLSLIPIFLFCQIPIKKTHE